MNTYALKNQEKNYDTSFFIKCLIMQILLQIIQLSFELLRFSISILFIYFKPKNILHHSKHFQNKFLFEIQHFDDHILSVYRDPILYI